MKHARFLEKICDVKILSVNRWTIHRVNISHRIGGWLFYPTVTTCYRVVFSRPRQKLFHRLHVDVDCLLMQSLHIFLNDCPVRLASFPSFVLYFLIRAFFDLAATEKQRVRYTLKKLECKHQNIMVRPA
jgi:hypothetical protein